jgi:amino acid transporter
MTTMRKLGIALAALIALLFAGTLFYFMPRANKVHVTGTDVKRMDQEDTTTGEQKTRDVWFVYATDIETQKALAFRNEDNGWYFKFNSGDIAAEASKLAKSEARKIALIKYYGLRIAILDSFPNVLSLKEVAEDYVYIPWFNMIVLVVLLIVFLFLGFRVRRVFRKTN